AGTVLERAVAALFFKPGDARNTTLAVVDTPSVSRALLFALLLALNTVGPRSRLRVFTTDDYLVQSFCHWAEHNAKLDWRVPNGDVLCLAARSITAR
ncbi:hypothetical protein C8T65DRAFT_549156, partial [Cerioporus squamosus]